MGSANQPINAQLSWQSGTASPEAAVLISGGLDSAILLAESLRYYSKVYPIYVRSGLYWEAAELGNLRKYLEALRMERLGRLQLLDLPVADLYGGHWSITGKDVPDGDSPDEAVFLPGRNVLLLAKAMLWCHAHGVGTLALGHLASNPFPDATVSFCQAFQDVVNQAVGGSVQIVRPYFGLTKAEVLSRGHCLPLELTFSCIRPVTGEHCGVCNKCAERRRAFAEAGLVDATAYARKDACIA
jgi:7-cyano-7-deazaguanine synthase